MGVYFPSAAWGNSFSQPHGWAGLGEAQSSTSRSVHTVDIQIVLSCPAAVGQAWNVQSFAILPKFMISAATWFRQEVKMEKKDEQQNVWTLMFNRTGCLIRHLHCFNNLYWNPHERYRFPAYLANGSSLYSTKPGIFFQTIAGLPQDRGKVNCTINHSALLLYIIPIPLPWAA